jgi:DNA polymerase bacteriophage-type
LIISVDFETYSECDIRSAGAWAYADHPSTEVLCLAWAVEDEPPKLWTPDMPAPSELFGLIERGAKVWAWNSFFELAIWQRVLMWPTIPIAQWSDTAALAAAQAYPRALGKCGEFMGMSGDAAKDKRGKYLIQRLCKPYRGKRVEDPELLQELYDYCLQDVVAESEIRKQLRPLHPGERLVWEADQRMNLRGVKLDAANCEHAIEIIKKVESELNQEVFELTDGELASTSSRAKSLDWINRQGLAMDSYDKAAVTCALEGVCPPKVYRFLQIRQALSKSSTKKFQAMLACLGRDGRAHGTGMYHGAATGRWSGRHFQPQNLPRPIVDDVDPIIDALRFRCPDQLPGEPMALLASCLRGMLIASKGRRLIVSDYSAIEARVLAWLAGHESVLQSFKDGLDLYKVTASDMYGIPYSNVDKDQRFIGKVASLALGYQGGVKAFQKMAANYGTDVDDTTALKIRDDWRAANRPIVKLWHEVGRAAMNALYRGREEKVSRGAFFTYKPDLYFRLPSGRCLCFPRAFHSPNRWPSNGKLTYQGMNNFTHKWGTIDTYGGSLVQSITQAVARDLLAHALLKIDAAGYDPIMTVHDEIVADTKIGHGSLDEFNKLMCELPGWAKGLPVDVEGYEADRYRK